MEMDMISEDNSGFSINELPFEILMEILEYFSIPEIARFPMTCTHWRDLMQQDHFWASLARKTYGQYVGETPTKKQLEELSKRCGQDLTFMHWLQYRSLFGLTMNMAVHVGVSVPDNVFDYKVTLEPGLNAVELDKIYQYYGVLINSPGVRVSSWNSTFYLVVTPESGDPIRKEVPLISIQDLGFHDQIRHRGKVFKFKIKITKLMNASFFVQPHYKTNYFKLPLDVVIDIKHLTMPDLMLKLANVQLKSHSFKEIFRYENPFLYPPACTSQPHYYSSNLSFIYQNLTIHEYIPIMAKNFNQTIQSQMQLYLAEIVCGFETLQANGLHLADSIPIIKKDGHLQFIYAGPRNLKIYSYFGLAPEKTGLTPGNYRPHLICTPFQTECYLLGLFMLQVCTGQAFDIQVNQITKASVPSSLPVELGMLLSTLLDGEGKERPKHLLAIKKDPYFKGIDWHKMRQQKWSPKFLPNLE